MRKSVVLEAVALYSALALGCLIMGLTISKLTKKESVNVIEIPASYDKSYTEDYAGYKLLEDMETVDWETFEADPDLVLTMNAKTLAGTQFTVQSMRSNVANQTPNDVSLAILTENDAWKLITNGMINQYPSGSYNSYASKLAELKSTNTETITVNVWYWANPDDDTDMSKVVKQKTFAVNSVLAETFEHIFADIFNDPSKPVLNLADSGMGTWVLRGKNHNGNAGISAHALGVAIDINPSTGSFKINGRWYGNGYRQLVMSKDIWEQLPECHTKYHVLYEGCPIVETFKAYGFVWGGDWFTTKDPMHFSYIGDGSNAREIGISNYAERQ